MFDGLLVPTESLTRGPHAGSPECVQQAAMLFPCHGMRRYSTRSLGIHFLNLQGGYHGPHSPHRGTEGPSLLKLCYRSSFGSQSLCGYMCVPTPVHMHV